MIINLISLKNPTLFNAYSTRFKQKIQPENYHCFRCKMNTQLLKEHIASSSLLPPLLLLSINSLFCNAFISTTQVNKKYTGRVLKTFFNVDWLSCLQKCSRIEQCVSYNFEKHSVRSYCVLYDSGNEVSCDGKTPLIHSEKSFYQQLKLLEVSLIVFHFTFKIEI